MQGAGERMVTVLSIDRSRLKARAEAGDAGAAVYDALRTMRETRSHLAIVTDNSELIGVVTLTDVLARLRPAAGAGIGSGTLAG